MTKERRDGPEQHSDQTYQEEYYSNLYSPDEPREYNGGKLIPEVKRPRYPNPMPFIHRYYRKLLWLVVALCLVTVIGTPIVQFFSYLNSNPDTGCTLPKVENVTIGVCKHKLHLDKPDWWFVYNYNADANHSNIVAHLDAGTVVISSGWSLDNKVYVVYLDDGSQYPVAGADELNETSQHPANYVLTARVDYGPSAKGKICSLLHAVVLDMQRHGIKNPNWTEHYHYCEK